MHSIPFLFVALLGLGSWVVSQDAPSAPVQDEEAVDPIQKWIDLLGDPRYRVREEAYQELQKLGAEAKDALNAAADHEDPEVRWRVQRLQEVLGNDPREKPRLRVVDPRDETHDPLRDWRQHRRNLFRDDEHFGPITDDMEEILQRVRDLQAESMQRWMQRPFAPLRPGSTSFPFEDLDGQDSIDPFDMDLQPGASWSFHRNDNGEVQSIRIRVAPDGTVEAEQRTGEDLTTVEAGSLDELKRLHPEWFEDLDVRMRVPRSMGPWKLLDSTAGRGPQLGVQVESVHPAVSDYLGLDPGDGLMVRGVVAGGLAEQLGVKSNDLLLEINGVRIRDQHDVRVALSRAPGSHEVEIVVLRKGAEKVLRRL